MDEEEAEGGEGGDLGQGLDILMWKYEFNGTSKEKILYPRKIDSGSVESNATSSVDHSEYRQKSTNFGKEKDELDFVQNIIRKYDDGPKLTYCQK